MQMIIMVINQIKGNNLGCQQMLRNTVKHIFPCPLKYSFWLFTASKYVFSLFKKWLFYVRYLLAPRNLSIQIFNQSIQVSLSLKLIVQVTLALIYRTLFNSVLPTYVSSQPTPAANTWICKSLFNDERTRKITSVANPIRRKCLKFASKCLESSLTQWIKCAYRNLRSNLSSSQKFPWCA